MPATPAASLGTLHEQFLLSMLESRMIAAPGLNINYVSGTLSDAINNVGANILSEGLHQLVSYLNSSYTVTGANLRPGGNYIPGLVGIQYATATFNVGGSNPVTVTPQSGYITTYADGSIHVVIDWWTQKLIAWGIPDFQFNFKDGQVGIGKVDKNRFLNGVTWGGKIITTNMEEAWIEYPIAGLDQCYE